MKFCAIHGTEVGMFRSGFGWIAVRSVEYVGGGGPSHFSLSPGVKNSVKNKCFMMREGLCSRKASLSPYLGLPSLGPPSLHCLWTRRLSSLCSTVIASVILRRLLDRREPNGDVSTLRSHLFFYKLPVLFLALSSVLMNSL